MQQKSPSTRVEGPNLAFFCPFPYLLPSILDGGEPQLHQPLYPRKLGFDLWGCIESRIASPFHLPSIVRALVIWKEPYVDPELICELIFDAISGIAPDRRGEDGKHFVCSLKPRSWPDCANYMLCGGGR